jgi:hypothetical protein
MRVYRLGAEVDRYRPLTVVHDDDFRKLSALHDQPVPLRWVPVEVEWLDERDSLRKPVAEFPSFGGIPAFRQKALEALKDLLEPNGVILPLQMTGESVFAYKVTHEVDALDEDRSDLTRFSTGRIMGVQRFAFFADSIDGAPIFKVPQLRSYVFVTDTFAERVRRSGLTGFVLDEVWSDEEHRNG